MPTPEEPLLTSTTAKKKANDATSAHQSFQKQRRRMFFPMGKAQDDVKFYKKGVTLLDVETTYWMTKITDRKWGISNNQKQTIPKTC